MMDILVRGDNYSVALENEDKNFDWDTAGMDEDLFFRNAEPQPADMPNDMHFVGWYKDYTLQEPFDFDEGENYLDGAHTLAFVRERMAFKAEGDFRRGRNQIAAIKGIINKATSPAILTNYSAVLDAVSDMMLTDMPSSFITQLTH